MGQIRVARQSHPTPASPGLSARTVHDLLSPLEPGYTTRAGKITRWRTGVRCSAGSSPPFRNGPPTWCRVADMLSAAVLLPAPLAPRIPLEATDNDSGRDIGRVSEPSVALDLMPVVVMPRSSRSTRPRASPPGMQSEYALGRTPPDAPPVELVPCLAAPACTFHRHGVRHVMDEVTSAEQDAALARGREAAKRSEWPAAYSALSSGQWNPNVSCTHRGRH
jgi:hypothetical protein